MNIGKYVELYSKDLELKNYSKSTIENYCSQVNCFLHHFNSMVTKPSEISEKQIKDWLLMSKSINGRKHRLSALKSFYKYTINQPMKFRYIEYPRADKKLPTIISRQHLLQCISRIENLKHKAIIMLAYSTGMRVSEVCNLKISDIDTQRMIINIRSGKGMKDRIVALSANVLETLNKYYLEYKPNTYVFNGQFDLQYSHRSCNEIVKKYIGSQYHFHELRHANATALLEAGTDIRIIQKHLGHSNVKTTEIYTFVSTRLLQEIPLPI